MSHSEPTVTLVAAVARNRVIGVAGALPWNLPEDLRRFRQLTMGNPIVMGRATFESIGRPLPGRTNIVLTRNSRWQAPGAIAVHGAAQALGTAERSPGGTTEIFVIGGGQIYAAFWERANRLELTAVDAAPKGDTFFPHWDATHWRKTSASAHDGPPPYEFQTWERLAERDT